MQQTSGYSIATLFMDIAGLLIAVPAFIFIAGYFILPFNIIALVGLGSYLYVILLPWCQRVRGATKSKKHLTCLHIGAALLVLLAAVIYALSPGYVVFTPSSDLPKYFMIFHDLLDNHWPVVTHDCVVQGMGCNTFMRYAPGYYVLPVVIGKILGTHNLTWVLAFCSTAMYAALFVVLLSALRHTIGVKWAAVLAFICLMLAGDWGGLVHMVQVGWPGLRVPNENIFGPRLEYISVPMHARHFAGHAIPAMYSAAFFLTAIMFRRYSWLECIVALFAVSAWSPFAAIGFALLLLPYIWQYRPPLLPAGLRMPWVITLFCALACTLSLALYYQTDTSRIPMRLLWQRDYLPFMLVNVAPWVVLAALLLPTMEKPRACFWFILLAVLPVLYLGEFGDLSRNAAAPLLLVLKFFIIRSFWQLRARIVTLVLSAIVLVPCLLDGVGALTNYGFPYYNRYDLAGFDPKHEMVRLQRENYAFVHQYYADCDELDNYVVDCGAEWYPDDALTPFHFRWK